MEYFWYRPTANTQAYFDLKTDFTDKSWNGRNATVNGWSITSKWVAYSSISNSTFQFSCPWVATRTIAVWVKYNGGSASNWRNISWVGWQSNWYYHGMFIANTSRWDLTIQDWKDAVSNVGIDNNRHLLVGVFSSWNSKLYLDKTLIATNTNWIRTGNNTGWLFSKWWNEAFIWYIGEIIIEEWNWSESQITDYYDKVKKNYTN